MVLVMVMLVPMHSCCLQSAALDSSLVLYDAIAGLVAATIVASTVFFVGTLAFEVFRAFRFARYHERAQVWRIVCLWCVARAGIV